MKKLVLYSRIFIVSIILFAGVVSSEKILAAAAGKEPNNTKKTAQIVTIGKQYDGVVLDGDNEDEDYYKIKVKEGKLYKITVFNMKDLGDYAWETLIASLCKDTDTNDNIGREERNDTKN